jgi:hypothetical protein
MVRFSVPLREDEKEETPYRRALKSATAFLDVGALGNGCAWRWETRGGLSIKVLVTFL